jgi:hypothetical protein
MGCDYVTGDRVLATCSVSTAGCLSGKEMLFVCKAMCNTQNPGTIVNENQWGIASQCNEN